MRHRVLTASLLAGGLLTLSVCAQPPDEGVRVRVQRENKAEDRRKEAKIVSEVLLDANQAIEVKRAERPMGDRSNGNQGGGENRGGRAMMMGDPMQMFDRFAKGKDVISRSDLDPMQQMMFDRFAPMMGITNGQVSRDQFRNAAQQLTSRMADGGGMRMMGGFTAGAPGAGGPTGDMMNQFYERRFRESDKNNDGLLQVEEMSDALKAEWKKWDTNNDGAVDLGEFKGYIQVRFGQRGDNPAGLGEPNPANPEVPNPPPGQSPDADDQRNTVYRAGKLPQGLPAWFAQYDTDADGQVGLYEWVKAAKGVSEFREMDRNDDGLLTAEEVMKFTSEGKSSNGNVALVSNSPGNTGPSATFGAPPRGEWPGRGDNGGGQRGPGGRGMWGSIGGDQGGMNFPWMSGRGRGGDQGGNRGGADAGPGPGRGRGGDGSQPKGGPDRGRGKDKSSDKQRDK